MPSARALVVRRALLTAGIVAASFGSSNAGFTDVSAAAGIDDGDVTYGLAWGDLDGDGARDLLTVRHFFRPKLHHNLGNGMFDDEFFPPLFDAQDNHGPVLFDLEADGDLDIYLSAGADAGSGALASRLYRNDGGFSFENVAAAVGLADSLARGRSASVMDFDRDGFADLFVAKAPRVASPNTLFRNQGGGQFTDVAAAYGVADAFGSVGGAWGDYDRDGDADLLISGEEQSGYETRLYRNDGGSFANVTSTAAVGLGLVTSAAWGDFDKDGDLDLAAGLGDEAYFDAVSWDADTTAFFFNFRFGEDGTDGFSFVTTGDSVTFDVYVDDFYRPEDIYIGGSMDNPPFGAAFTLAAVDVQGVPQFTPGVDFGMYIWRQQPSFDLWSVRCSAPPAESHNFGGNLTGSGAFSAVATVQLEDYVPGTAGKRGTRLWRNDGGVLKNVSQSAGLGDSSNVRHVTWVDWDQDGDLDLHVLAKGDTERQNEPDHLYRNDGGTFVDVAAAEGLVGPTKGLGDACAFEDFDDDGDLDAALLSGAGPRVFARQETDRLYRNDGPVGNFLRVDLEGTVSSEAGYGAWVTCYSQTAGMQSHYVTGNAWRGSPVMVDPYFGLGPDAVVDSVVVEWPSGLRTVSESVAAGGTLQVVEGPVSAAPSIAPLEGRLTLSARPNPAVGSVALAVGGRGRSACRIEIFDAGGRRVWARTLDRESEPRVVWDGRNAEGKRVAAGTYFARVREGDRAAEAKLIRLRP